MRIYLLIFFYFISITIASQFTIAFNDAQSSNNQPLNSQIIQNTQSNLQSISINQSQDPLNQIIDQQILIRQSISMAYQNYHGYPFAIAQQTSQSFYLQFPQQQTVKAQVFVYWIQSDNTVKPPQYSQTQRIQVSIVKAKNQQLLLRQQFLTTTGISFNAEKNQRYILSFHNDRLNQIPKMIELAISYLHPIGEKHFGVNETLLQVERNTSVLHLQLLSRIKHTQQSMMFEEEMRQKLRKSSGNFLYYAVWEILCVGALMIGQIFILKKIIQKGCGSII